MIGYMHVRGACLSLLPRTYFYVCIASTHEQELLSRDDLAPHAVTILISPHDVECGPYPPLSQPFLS